MKPGFTKNPPHQTSGQGSTICFVAYRPILSRKAALPPLEDSLQGLPKSFNRTFQESTGRYCKIYR
jgi:hypothetical protein